MDQVQSQPQQTHHQPGGAYNITIVAIVSSLIIGFIGGFFVGGSMAKPGVDTPAKGLPAATNMETVNWKTYTATNQQFSFRYPEQLVMAHATYIDGKPDQNIPHFYLSEAEAQAAIECNERNEATLQAPCDAGLFDVADVTNADAVTKQPIDLYVGTSDPSLPKTQEHTDSQGRKWTILGPTFVLGGTQTDAQVKIDGKTYQVKVQIWDRFMNSSQQGAAQAQLTFITQLLDTLTFSY